MNNHIISGFDTNTDHKHPFDVDFSSAEKLNRSGSTCDAYECTIQHRRLFVKRLKAQYRHNPLYRAAFSKEYQLGVSLSHPSLPGYFGFGDDYILIDYVEGDTLAGLIKRGDRRLENKRFVRKLLTELIDAVDYLHSRNIVHCDIKADNIIVSPYHDRPATLIDLDKAYTAWLGDTPGNPAKYNCSSCADGTVDFKGLGLIAGRLGMKRVAKACADCHASADSIRAALNSKLAGLWWLPAVIALAGGAIAISHLFTAETPASRPEVIVRDTVSVADAPHATTATQAVAVPQRKTVDTAWISALIAEKSALINGYRQQFLKTFDSDSVSIIDKRMAFLKYSELSGMATAEIMLLSVRQFSDIAEYDVQKVIRNHPGWIRLENEARQMIDFINDWNRSLSATESRHSSGHPVSQPDTTPDAHLRAPHR